MSLPTDEMDEASAISAIAGLLDLDEDDAPSRPAPSKKNSSEDSAQGGEEDALDEAPDDDLVSQDDEGEDDPEAPAILLPKSWKSEHRTIFDALPDDAKRVISERDDENSRAVSRYITQAAETRKAADAELAKATQAQTQQAQALQQLIVMSLPELQQLQNINMHELAQTNPGEWARLKSTQEQVGQRINLAAQQLQYLQTQQNQRQTEMTNQQVAEEVQKVQSMIPDYADPQKAQTRLQNIQTVMKEAGLSDDDFARINDARIFKMLDEYAELKAADKARKSTQLKKTAQPAPKAVPQTAAPTRDRTKQSSQKQRFETLMRSNGHDKSARLNSRQQEDLAVSLIADLL